jgi:hypothetical protein
MVRITTYNYEQSSEGGRERHVRIPYARQTDQTPTLHDPAEVTGLPLVGRLTGTVVTLDATNSVAIINTSGGAVYRHNVRNVLTYNPGVAELTWGAVNVGDAVYYDPSATMPAFTKLSTSPLDLTGAVNSFFGWVVLLQDETVASYPKGGAIAGDTLECAVLQK